MSVREQKFVEIFTKSIIKNLLSFTSVLTIIIIIIVIIINIPPREFFLEEK